MSKSLPTVYAIVPIKHVSTRVPGKNYRLMDDKPLYWYVLSTLTKCKYINKIYVDTNSPIISEGVRKHFPNIIIYDRPESLCGNTVSTNDLLMNIINNLNLDADYYFQTHVTNPLLKQETIDDAIHFFIQHVDKYDSLFSAKVLKTRLYDKNFNDMNHNRFNLIPTQDLDPIYDENSCIYIFSKNTLFKNNSRIGPQAAIYVMDSIESTDIDYENDFILAEQLVKLKNKYNE